MHSNTEYMIRVLQNKPQINVTFSHVDGHHDDNYLLEYPALMAIVKTEYNIRFKSELHHNLRNNAPTPPGLHNDPILCRICGTKVTYPMGESLREKTSYK